MIHGPLAKVDNQAFGSIKEILDHVAANPMFMQYADMIAQLFLDRFRCVCVCVYGDMVELSVLSRCFPPLAAVTASVV